MNTISRPECKQFLFVLFVTIALFLTATKAFGSDLSLHLVDDKPVRDLRPNILVYFDATRSMTISEMQSKSLNEFDVVTTREPTFSHTDDAIWLRVTINNNTDELIQRILLIETNFMYKIDVMLQKAETTEVLLSQDEYSQFSSRPIPHPNLVSKLILNAHESGTIWIRYKSKGDTALPISIETEESFIALTHANTAKYFVFYAVILIFLAMSLVAFAQQRSFKFLAYFLYASSVLIYVMHRDGFTFQYFWPNFPGFNNIASLPLACAITFFAAQFTRTYLETKSQYPFSDKVLRIIMIAAFLIVGALAVINESDLKLYAYLYVSVSSVIFLAIGLNAWRREGRRVLYFIFGWLGIVLSSVVVTGIALTGYDIPRSTTLDYIRFAMVFDAAMMGMAVLEGINAIRRERDASLRDQVNMLQTNLGLQGRLDALEKRYNDIQTIAEDRGRVLADATHDLRQPLFSLRASIQNSLSSNTLSTGRLDQINASFTYLESLVDEYMEAALSGTENSATLLAPEIDETPLLLIITSVAEMFADEAQAKNIQLRTVDSKRTVNVPAMALLRMVSNLVSNAIKYTDAGSVLIGCRTRNGEHSIEVYDTGAGMTHIEIDQILTRHHRGDNTNSHPDGRGLGLSIVSELAEANNVVLDVVSQPGKGSSFRLLFNGKKSG